MRAFPSRTTYLRLLVGLAVVAAVVAFVLGEALFEHGSPNLDDLDYRNQASALGHGDLTLSADTHLPSFRPYLSGLDDGRVIFTHQPPWPAAMALVDVVGLPPRTAAAAAAGGAVLAFALFAHEATLNRRTTLIASVLLAGSPLFLLQSATLLAYTPSVALAFATLGLFLRSLRTGSRPLAFAAGAVLGLLVFNRPFDAALVVIAVVVTTLWGPARSRLVPVLGPLGAGALPGLALLLAYNRAVMGSPLRFPYTVNSLDTIGFGLRQSYDSGPTPAADFGPSEAWTALGRQLAEVPRFTAGGVVVLALAAVGIGLHLRRRSTLLLVLLAITFPLGYFFWWTTWNTTNFRLQLFLGPAYYFVSVGAVVILAAVTLDRLWSMRIALAAGVAVAITLLTAYHLGNIVDYNREFTHRRDALVELAESPDVVPRVVFTPRSYQHDPFVHFFNDTELDAAVLYALDLGSQNARVLVDSPERQGYRLWQEAEPKGLFDPRVTRIAALDTHEVEEGIDLVVRFERAADGADVVAYAQTEGQDALVSDVSGCERGCEMRWRLTPDELSNATGRRTLTDEDHQTIRIGFAVHPEGGDESTDRYEVRLALATRADGAVALVTPGETWHRYAFPDGKTPWTPEDLDGVLALDVAAPEE